MKKQPRRSVKGPATRERVLAAALDLFRERGFDATTMRDVAAAAGLSVGAAYHYFPSKEAIVLAWYERTQDEHAAIVRPLLAATSGLRARLGVVLDRKLELAGKDRKLLAALAGSAAGGRTLSVFSTTTKGIRERAIALFDEALGPSFPADSRRLAASALWLLHLGFLYLLLQDRSKHAERTRRLAAETLDLAVPLLGMMDLPAARPVRARLLALIEDAARAVRS